jgi:hypothetical protein
MRKHKQGHSTIHSSTYNLHVWKTLERTKSRWKLRNASLGFRCTHPSQPTYWRESCHFSINLDPIRSPWRQGKHVPPKHRVNLLEPTMSLAQKPKIWEITTVKIHNLTYFTFTAEKETWIESRENFGYTDSSSTGNNFSTLNRVFAARLYVTHVSYSSISVNMAEIRNGTTFLGFIMGMPEDTHSSSQCF